MIQILILFLAACSAEFLQDVPQSYDTTRNLDAVTDYMQTMTPSVAAIGYAISDIPAISKTLPVVAALGKQANLFGSMGVLFGNLFGGGSSDTVVIDAISAKIDQATCTIVQEIRKAFDQLETQLTDATTQIQTAIYQINQLASQRNIQPYITLLTQLNQLPRKNATLSQYQGTCGETMSDCNQAFWNLCSAMYDNLYSIYLYENEKIDGNSLQKVQLQGNYIFKILVMTIPSITQANKLYQYKSSKPTYITRKMLDTIVSTLDIDDSFNLAVESYRKIIEMSEETPAKISLGCGSRGCQYGFYQTTNQLFKGFQWGPPSSDNNTHITINKGNWDSLDKCQTVYSGLLSTATCPQGMFLNKMYAGTPFWSITCCQIVGTQYDTYAASYIETSSQKNSFSCQKSGYFMTGFQYPSNTTWASNYRFTQLACSKPKYAYYPQQCQLIQNFTSQDVFLTLNGQLYSANNQLQQNSTLFINNPKVQVMPFAYLPKNDSLLGSYLTQVNQKNYLVVSNKTLFLIPNNSMFSACQFDTTKVKAKRPTTSVTPISLVKIGERVENNSFSLKNRHQVCLESEDIYEGIQTFQDKKFKIIFDKRRQTVNLYEIPEQFKVNSKNLCDYKQEDL